MAASTVEMHHSTCVPDNTTHHVRYGTMSQTPGLQLSCHLNTTYHFMHWEQTQPATKQACLHTEP